MIKGIIPFFKIQECYAPQKSIFDLYGKKLPVRMVAVNTRLQSSHSCIAIDDKGVCISAQQMLSMSTTNVMCLGY